MTCLFIGNLIKSVSETKLFNTFKNYGKCKIELKVSKNVDKKGPYAFIEYEDPECAHSALKDLNKTNLNGINGPARARIEYSYKRKLNDKLTDNDVNDDDDALNFSDDSEDVKRPKPRQNFTQTRNFTSEEKRNRPERSRDRDFKGSREGSIRKNNRDRDQSKDNDKKDYKSSALDNDDDIKRKNVCFICKLPGHFAKDCVLTKESCYECGEKGHIAKECMGRVREAKYLTENRVKAICSQQSAYKFISTGNKIRNITNYLKNSSTNIDS